MPRGRQRSIRTIVTRATAPIAIAVGHQSGDELYDEVYLSVYEVEGVTSDYHAVARVTIVRMDR